TALCMAAGSFRDTTRVAATAPETVAMWLEANAGAVVGGLTSIIDRLTLLRTALQGGMSLPEEVHHWLRRAHEVRKDWPPRAGTGMQIAASREAVSELGLAGGWITHVAGDHLEAILPAVSR
ncbi:MAG: prephenate dehydrogenase dimerization domain-containing protein, partial [Mycobacteriales bacterium]